jgi:hypothetical protein
MRRWACISSSFTWCGQGWPDQAPQKQGAWSTRALLKHLLLDPLCRARIWKWMDSTPKFLTSTWHRRLSKGRLRQNQVNAIRPLMGGQCPGTNTLREAGRDKKRYIQEYVRMGAEIDEPVCEADGEDIRATLWNGQRTRLRHRLTGCARSRSARMKR